MQMRTATGRCIWVRAVGDVEYEDPVNRLKPARLIGAFQDITARRADKLTSDVDLFTGEVWLGQRAMELGLIDGIGHLKPMMKARFGDKVRFREYSTKRGVFSRLGARVVQDAVQGIEERAAFARFGL